MKCWPIFSKRKAAFSSISMCRAIDQTEAIKTIKRKITDLDAMKIQEQKKAVRSGYDMDILPSDLATYGEDAKKAAEQIADPERTAFHADFFSAECGRHPSKSWATMCSKPQVWHRSITALLSGWTTSRNRALCPVSAAGHQPDKDSAQPYHLQRGGVRALCDAGAFPERRGHVLRHQRKIPQHDHAGPQAGPVSQRPKAGYARQRQIHELQV